MARRSGFGGFLSAVARDMARAERNRQRAIREAERESVRQARAALKAHREGLREAAREEKEARRQYAEERQQETDSMNSEVKASIDSIDGILTHTLSVDDTISFSSLRMKDNFRTFQLPAELATEPAPPSRAEYFAAIRNPSFARRLIPGATKAHEGLVARAEQQFESATRSHRTKLEQREALIRVAKEQYEQEKAAFLLKVRERNSSVEELERAYLDGDPVAVRAYCSMVLERSQYPEGFPQSFRLAYDPASREMVVEYQLPVIDAIPAVSEYRYVKAKDAIAEKAMPPAERKRIYRNLVASICLRTMHELLESDQASHIDILDFNGFIETVDPATGKDVRPCVISVRTTRDRFLEINLGRVDVQVCLKNLGAQVSSRPDELVAVRPVVEFNMVDRRFVDQEDVLGKLDDAPNLMDLTPFDFENLVSNLFSKMGLDTKQTRSSKDGGVDAVAFDHRPVVGGRVVIQAKRYRNVVGVSAVRDLYGTMINEGANKGILVATSHYGRDAYDFAKDKPVELIDGGGLIYLLEQNGVRARIIMPEPE